MDRDLTKSLGNSFKIVDLGEPNALAYLKQTINYIQEGYIETISKLWSNQWSENTIL